MLADFGHRSPTRLIFGLGSASKVGAEARALGLRRVLLVSGRGPTRSSAGYAAVSSSLEESGVSALPFSELGSDPSIEEVLGLAEFLLTSKAEGIVAYGGGSPMDCAKSASLYAANALKPGAPQEGAKLRDFLYGKRRYQARGLPLIALPTTAGTGSEMSNAAVTTDREARKKQGMSSEYFFPELAIVDPGLQASMPPALTAATGMDALTHVIESAVSKNATPISRALCGLAAGLIAGYLRKAYEEGSNLDARGAMALASAIAGTAFSQSGLGMVHGFAHPIGAIGGIAHGLANAVMLPYVMEASLKAAPQPFASLARDFGLPVEGRAPEEAARLGLELVRELGQALKIPRRLRELGLPASELPAILESAQNYRMRASSPAAFSDEELGSLLESAY